MTTSPEVQPDLDFGDGFDFTDPGLLARGLPVEQFARLRRASPVWWNPQDPDKGGGFRDGGFWAISKHAHIREISRDPDAWSSNLNGCVMRYANGSTIPSNGSFTSEPDPQPLRMRSSAGQVPSTFSNVRRAGMPRSGARGSKRVSEWVCSIALPTTTRTSSSIPSRLTFAVTPTRIWASAETARTIASALTWREKS